MNTYKIKTLADIFNQVPTDKIELCMEEISRSMRLAAETCDLIRTQEGCENLDNQDIVQWPEFTEWIDDDRGEIGFNAYDKEGNTLKVRITKETEE